MTSPASLDGLCINTIRTLSIDMVQKANSGHPGTPLGAAPLAYVLWDRFLKHNPADPWWPDRDRFVLSAGHASAMLYALLHLTGYDLSLEDLKNFRQWESKAPGHPEYGLVPGVETTTGPLGQGFANGIGIAIAERWLAARYNRPGHEVVNHYTYGIVSDGDLQEGVASEAASLAGTLKLGKLIYLYDDNDISIDGSTDLAFTEHVAERFTAYGWHVVGPVDGMDPDAVDAALRVCRSQAARPSLIICRTVIGYGSPNKAGKASSHGEPLGEAEVKLTRASLGWPLEEPFAIPPVALAHFRLALNRGKEKQATWQTNMDKYRQSFPEEARTMEQDLRGELPPDWDKGLTGLYKAGDKPVATREASGRVMNVLSGTIRTLIGGSADLAASTKAVLKDQGSFGPDNYAGRNIHFGVREHAMGSIANGLALHGGALPYTGTFLVFSDYMRPPIRLASLMGIRVIFIFSHDSIALGEDGPTHQPVEHLMALRAIPGLVVLRPADATETVEAWKTAIERRNGPTVLITTRQNLPVLDRTVYAPADGLKRGGYVLWEATASPAALILATGSEVHLALEAGRLLKDKGIAVRVVSLPSWELFESQPKEYRDSVLPPNIRVRVSIEAGITLGWERYVGCDGVAIGVNRFGASAPGPLVYERLGLTARHAADEVMKLLGRDR